MSRRGKAIGAMLAAITALTTISLLVLADVPAEPDDSAEQMSVYLSLVLFVMALALAVRLVLAIIRKGGAGAEMDDFRTLAVSYLDDEASDIELEFRALEMEIDKEEMG